MPTQIQELARLIGTLKKILPHGEKSFSVDPFTCLRVHVLEYIIENKDVGMNEIARFLSITPPSATSIINKLVAAEILARVEDKKDRRKVLLKVTPKGKKMLAKGQCLIEDHMGKIFSVLSKDELGQFIYLLKKIVKTHKEQNS